jgi:hypothetical protein
MVTAYVPLAKDKDPIFTWPPPPPPAPSNPPPPPPPTTKYSTESDEAELLAANGKAFTVTPALTLLVVDPWLLVQIT